MKTRICFAFCVAVLCLCGCPLGTPRDHNRPHGHIDTTIAISPDDATILFNAAGAGGRDLYLLNLENLSVTRVAESPNYETSPSFSPDGMTIVYSAGVPGDRADHIFTTDRTGGSVKQLTNQDANDTSPRFSPDGSMIVFARDKTYNWGGRASNWSNAGAICVIAADGTGERQLTADDRNAFSPFFAADGQSVIFMTDNGCFSVPIDGSKTITGLGPSMMSASCTADAQRVVFSDGKYSPDHELFIANIDGSRRSQITNSANGCFHGIFSNDAKTVYFLMEEWPQGPTDHPKSSIWKVNTDGTGQKQITDLSLFDKPMEWKPKNSP